MVLKLQLTSEDLISNSGVKQPDAKIQIIGTYITLRIVDVVRLDRSREFATPSQPWLKFGI